jgi:hypothetical protein
MLHARDSRKGDFKRITYRKGNIYRNDVNCTDVGLKRRREASGSFPGDVATVDTRETILQSA